MSESPFGFFDVLHPGGEDIEKKAAKGEVRTEEEDPCREEFFNFFFPPSRAAPRSSAWRR
jgi:hypothetical protein